MKDVRILVTGSRDWPSPNAVESAIFNYMTDYQEEHGPARFTLVHGGCPTGADMQAHEWAKDRSDIAVEVHPAEWAKYGRRAGFIRNSLMVDLGADVCLAFIRNKSKGASMTANLAEKAGIDTRRMRL